MYRRTGQHAQNSGLNYRMNSLILLLSIAVCYFQELFRDLQASQWV